MLWKTIKSLLLKKTSNTTALDYIKDNGCVKSDPKSMCETFNKFFCSIGKSLSEKIQATSNHKIYLRNRVPSSLFLGPATPQEIQNIINKLNINKSCGGDQIPAYFILCYIALSLRIS